MHVPSLGSTVACLGIPEAVTLSCTLGKLQPTRASGCTTDDAVPPQPAIDAPQQLAHPEVSTVTGTVIVGRRPQGFLQRVDTEEGMIAPDEPCHGGRDGVACRMRGFVMDGFSARQALVQHSEGGGVGAAAWMGKTTGERRVIGVPSGTSMRGTGHSRATTSSTSRQVPSVDQPDPHTEI